jgi:hypothetical protein
MSKSLSMIALAATTSCNVQYAAMSMTLSLAP